MEKNRQAKSLLLFAEEKTQLGLGTRREPDSDRGGRVTRSNCIIEMDLNGLRNIAFFEMVLNEEFLSRF